MSQIQTFGIAGMPPAGPVLTLTGDFGPAVSPTAGNINIIGIGSAKYAFGILTSTTNSEVPSIPVSTLVIQPFYDTVQTTDGVVTEFPFAQYTLSPSQAIVFSANVIGNRDDYSAACGGYVTGVIRRPAIGATIIVGDSPLASEDADPGDAEFGFGLNGDTVQLFVQGLAGQTWNWTCTYTFQVQLI